MLPASVPIRLSGETDTDQLAEEQDRAAQNAQMEGIVDERVRAEITRPLRSLEDDNDKEMKSRKLGEPLATIPETSDEVMEHPVPIVHEDWKRERSTKSFPREPVELSGNSSGPKRMKLSCLRVNNVSAVQKPSTRTEESIAKSRAEHIKHLLETGAAKMRSRKERKSCKEKWWKMHTKKSPDIVRESLPRSRTHQCSRLLDLLAVKRGHGLMCFDAVAAFGQAPETELIFHRSSRGAQSNCVTARVVAMFESEGRLTQRSKNLARSLHRNIVVARLSRIFQTESEVPDNFLLK